MNRIYIILSFITLLNISCSKDFLDINTQKEVTRQGYVKDLSSLEHFHNGIYVLLSRDFEKGIGAAYSDIVADNIKPSISGTKALVAAYTWTQESSNAMDEVMDENSATANGLWRGSGYSIIRGCNFVIEELDKYHNEDPSRANKIKGEALALRAMIHLRILNIFAQPFNYSSQASHPGIPYITTSDITKSYRRESVKECYEKILADFNAALPLLPESVADTRKINRIAVKGFMARVYLFKEEFQIARQLAEELVQQYPLMTINDGYPEGVFKFLPINKTETYFQLAPYSLGSNSSYFLNLFLQYEPLVMFLPTQDIIDIISENPSDVRSNWVGLTNGQMLIKKFPVGVAEENPAIQLPETAYYPCMIRSSEMALTAAEAAAKLNLEVQARKYLNAVRQRADATIPSVNATGPALLDSIYKERRKELCFEGFRLFDLQRWNAGIHRKDVHPDYSGAKDLNYPNNRLIAPIPYQEIHSAGLEPNPGY